VVALGNAGGKGGTPSVATGTVTALNQSITASDEGSGNSEQLTGLIETNANIQPGDSGGSLVNSYGQVIGMDTAASSGTQFQTQSGQTAEQAYTIPINEATSIARQIEAVSRKVARGSRKSTRRSPLRNPSMATSTGLRRWARPDRTCPAGLRPLACAPLAPLDLDGWSFMAGERGSAQRRSGAVSQRRRAKTIPVHKSVTKSTRCYPDFIQRDTCCSPYL